MTNDKHQTSLDGYNILFWIGIAVLSVATILFAAILLCRCSEKCRAAMHRFRAYRLKYVAMTLCCFRDTEMKQVSLKLLCKSMIIVMTF